MIANLFAIVILNLLIFNRYYPITEGWFDTYGYLINLGLIPQKDFRAEGMVFFSYFCAFLLRHFQTFFALRLIGVIAYALVFLFSYTALAFIIPFSYAAIGAGLACIFSMSSVVFIAKDYHTFVDLTTGLTLICVIGGLVLTERRESGPRSRARFVLFLGAGLLCFASMFVKQNVGLFLSLGTFIYLIYAAIFNRKLRFPLAFFTLGFAVPVFAAFAAALSSGEPSILQGLFKNDSKGSPLAVLTRFITLDDNRHVILQCGALIAVWFFLSTLPFSEAQRRTLREKLQGFQPLINHLMGGLLVFIGFQFWFGFDGPINFVIRPLAAATVVLALFFSQKQTGQGTGRWIRDSKFAVGYFSWTCLILLYCNTQTASLNATGMLFPIAFSIAVLAAWVSKRVKVSKIFYFCFLFVVAMSMARAKLKSPYAWWGIHLPSVMQSSSQIDHPKFWGMTVDQQTKSLFEDVNSLTKQYSKSNQDVYYAPQIPIFYVLNEKLPPYGTPVEWFDYMSTSSGNRELEDFNRKPPNVIFFLDPPEWVDTAHEELLKKKTYIPEFRKALATLISKNEYTPILVKPLYVDEPTVTDAEVTLNVENSAWVGEPVLKLSGAYKSAWTPLRIEKASGDRVTPEKWASTKIELGDRIVATMKKEFSGTDFSSVGSFVAPKFYQLRAYVRSRSE